MSLGTSDLPAAAHDALARHAWVEAFELFGRADEDGALSGADLEGYAQAAFFTAHADLSLEATERAFAAYQAEGDPARAAYLALDLVREYSFRGRGSIASAWMRRAERLLDGLPEGLAHGYLALSRSEMVRGSGDVDEARRLAEEALAIATRTGDADLQAIALTSLGFLRIGLGETAEGFSLLEEATVGAVNGELSPIVTGMTYCTMISACRDLSDYKRASEWTEATQRWCERRSVSGFPGVCRVHRAEIVALTGDWPRAERELRQATDEIAAYGPIPPLGDGFHAIAEIRLRMGDLAGAQDAARQAHALGHSPEPVRSLIRLAEGKRAAALSSITAALAEQTWDRWTRTRFLPAQVEIAIAAGDVALARRAADELDELLPSYESPALRARRHEALGRVLLAEGDHAASVRETRTAIAGWLEVEAPYEVARCRLLLSRALRAAGDEDAADLELGLARDTFERLGAMLDAAEAERLVKDIEERRAGPIPTRKTFLFTDIVGSTNLAEAMGDDPWERLLRWHDDALREAFARAGGEVVNSTGDGFFVAFDAAARAVDCAIAIQRALDEHRRSSGFAPPVRIGVHAAMANRRGDDYSGVGVHVAARVASQAGGGEIVASVETLTEAGVDGTDVRAVELKGVTEKVAVATVPWST
jgi:class 3 adenylate cyclase